MVEKPYQWAKGATLGEHSKRKHKVLREYFHHYFRVRCGQIPQQTKFRIAVVDGFSGAGRYACGSPGSPLILIEGLRATLSAVNTHRSANSLPILEIECLFIFNDDDASAVEQLKEHCAPLLASIKDESPELHISVQYMTAQFETSYPTIKRLIETGGYRNVLFNLDQCGDSDVQRDTLVDIMRSTTAAEIFYTFTIQSLLAFLDKRDPARRATRLRHLGITDQLLDEPMSRAEWLGAAEKLVFNVFGSVAPYVSPFSINNPDGWRYWLIHFANNYRARQVYNNVLHVNATAQAHFGRPGLDMLAYDPTHEGLLYLFDQDGRATAKNNCSRTFPASSQTLVTRLASASSMKRSTMRPLRTQTTFTPPS